MRCAKEIVMCNINETQFVIDRHCVLYICKKKEKKLLSERKRIHKRTKAEGAKSFNKNASDLKKDLASYRIIEVLSRKSLNWLDI